MKFFLVVNDKQYEGFKLSVQTNNEEENKIAQELTKKLIEKIKQIDVSIQSYKEEEY
jgi:hypothetical protein